MTRDEYRKFLQYLFNEYVRNRLPRVIRHWHPMERDRFTYMMERLRRELSIIDYIYRNCDDPDDIYRTFRKERLRQMVDGIEDGVRLGKDLSDDAGITDCLERHFADILSGLHPDDFPKEDAQILSDLGIKNPDEELHGITVMMHNLAEKNAKRSEKVSIEIEFKRTVELLEREKEEFAAKEAEKTNATDSAPKKQRRWFKGLGQVGQGSALTIGNIALAIGTLKFPVSPETQTWGALVSAATGVGMIINGVGELRGE